MEGRKDTSCSYWGFPFAFFAVSSVLPCCLYCIFDTGVYWYQKVYLGPQTPKYDEHGELTLGLLKQPWETFPHLGNRTTFFLGPVTGDRTRQKDRPDS